MASPQLEDGHTKIANEILDQLIKIRIPGEAHRVLWAIIRKTYGWNKKEDYISYGQISKMTGLSRAHVFRAIKFLTDINLISKNGDGYVNKLKFNKNYESWKLSPNTETLSPKMETPKLSPNTETTVSKYGDKTVSKIGDNKRKEIKNTKEKIYAENSVEFQLSFFCVEKIKKNFPTIKFSKQAIKKSCEMFEKLVRIDKWDPELIKNIIIWTSEHDFWKKQFQSPLKLRKKDREGVKYIDKWYGQMRMDGKAPEKNYDKMFASLPEEEKEKIRQQAVEMIKKKHPAIYDFYIDYKENPSLLVDYQKKELFENLQFYRNKILESRIANRN